MLSVPRIPTSAHQSINLLAGTLFLKAFPRCAFGQVESFTGTQLSVTMRPLFSGDNVKGNICCIFLELPSGHVIVFTVYTFLSVFFISAVSSLLHLVLT